MDMGSGRQVTGAELVLGALAEGGRRDHHKIIRIKSMKKVPSPARCPLPARVLSQRAENREQAAGERLKGFSVVLITLLAALGAIVTWRAEVAASTAAGLTQRGVVVLINLAAERAKDQAIALSEEADVMRVQQLLDERDLLNDQLSMVTPGAAQDQLTTQYKVQFWVAEWRLRNVGGQFLPAERRHGTSLRCGAPHR